MPLTSDTRDWPCWFWFFFSLFDAVDVVSTIWRLWWPQNNLCSSVELTVYKFNTSSCYQNVMFFLCLFLYLFLCLSLVLCVLTIVGRQSYHKSIFFRQKIPLLALNSNKRSAIDFFLIPWHFFAAPKQSIISLNLTASEKNA